MPFNGSGGFVPLAAPIFPAVPNTIIASSYYNQNLQDIFGGLGNAVTRDGQSPATANLPMGGNKHTGAAEATAAGQYIVWGQLGAVPLPNLTGPLNITGTINVTSPTVGLNVRSGAAGSPATIQIGRTASEAYFSVVGIPNQLINGDVPGDMVLRAEQRMWLGIANIGHIRLDATTGATFSSSASFIAPTLTGLPSVSTVRIGTSSNFPYLQLSSLSAPVDNRIWDIYANGSQFIARTVSDSFGASVEWLKVDRVGVGVPTVTFPSGLFGIGGVANKNLDVVGNGPSVNIGIRNGTSSGFASLRLGDPGPGATGVGAALHYMGSTYAGGPGYFPDGTSLTAFGTGGLNFIATGASATMRFYGNGGAFLGVNWTGTLWDSTALEVRGGRFTQFAPVGAARNQFTQDNAGNAALATGWISTAFGDSLGTRIVIGQFAGLGVLGAHSSALSAWAQLITRGDGFVYQDAAGTARLGVDTVGRLYGGALHNNPSGISAAATQYVGSGTMIPILTTATNITATSFGKMMYMRVGNVVTCSGYFTGNITTAGANTVLAFSKPVASAFSSPADVRGTATYKSGSGIVIGGIAQANTGSLAIELDLGQPTFTGAMTGGYSISYEALP